MKVFEEKFLDLTESQQNILGAAFLSEFYNRRHGQQEGWCDALKWVMEQGNKMRWDWVNELLLIIEQELEEKEL